MAKRTIVEDANYKVTGLGFHGKSWPFIDGALLHAAFFGRSDYPEDPTYDYSLRGNRCVMNGDVPLTGSYCTPDMGNYWQLPFTDAEVLQTGVPDAFTVASLIYWEDNGNDASLLSSYFTSATPGFKFDIDDAAGTITARTFDGNPGVQESVNLSAGADTGTGWEMVAASWSSSGMKVYRRGFNDSSMLSSSLTFSVISTPLTMHPRAFLVGRDYNEDATTGGARIASTAIYDRTLNEAQLNNVYLELREFSDITF